MYNVTLLPLHAVKPPSMTEGVGAAHLGVKVLVEQVSPRPHIVMWGSLSTANELDAVYTAADGAEHIVTVEYRTRCGDHRYADMSEEFDVGWSAVNLVSINDVYVDRETFPAGELQRLVQWLRTEGGCSVALESVERYADDQG